MTDNTETTTEPTTEELEELAAVQYVYIGPAAYGGAWGYGITRDAARREYRKNGGKNPATLLRFGEGVRFIGVNTFGGVIYKGTAEPEELDATPRAR